MAGELIVLWHGESDDIAVPIDLDTFQELSGWLHAAEQPDRMTLHEAATALVPLAIQVAEALIRAGHAHEAGRLLWAATALRVEAEKDE